jgi:phospholipase C
MQEPIGHDPHQQERDAGHPRPVSRRKFLEKSAMAMAGGILFSCTGGKLKPSPTSVASSPTATVETNTPIKHVIYLMLENRSFDNVFGRFPGVNGATTGVYQGQEKRLIDCPDWLPSDLPHDRASALNNYADGTNGGFGLGPYGPVWSFSQFNSHHIPAYWQWAKDYAISDNFFASALGPSFPNHLYFVSGSSGGSIDNPENIGTHVADTSGHGGGHFKSWGCDAVGNVAGGPFVFVKDDKGQLNKHETCFEMPTIGGALSKKGVDWAYYAPLPGYSGYYWNAYNGAAEVFHTDLWHEHAQHNIDDLISDINGNKLKSVNWAVPYFEYSDHPPASSAFCHNWVQQIVNAVQQSELWSSTAIFITWDEWGGLYDHVVPPQIDDEGLGFRVPLLTISPYTPKGLIDDELGEFSTPLRFISDNWGLPHISPRIKRTHNMSHLFDFSQNPQKPRMATKKAKTFGSAWTYPGTFPGWPPGTVPNPESTGFPT